MSEIFADLTSLGWTARRLVDGNFYIFNEREQGVARGKRLQLAYRRAQKAIAERRVDSWIEWWQRERQS